MQRSDGTGSRWPRWPGRVGISLLVLVALLAGARWLMRAPSPDAFYSDPAALPVAPGMLIRTEPFARQVPAGTRGWRILYTTTRAGGGPAVASAIVLVGNEPAARRPVIAWAHGTTGVAGGCAPSLLDEPFAHAPAIETALARGWAIVATDYVGLGTSGPHPYLIGDGEARPVLDAVRAARQLGAAAVGDQFVVWGHSQGGHAALWTGISAPLYAPELHLAGVAAMAPATDLPAMLAGVHATPAGRIISAYLLNAYTGIYPDVRATELTSGARTLLARDIARHCMAGSSAWLALADALLAGGSLFDGEPGTGALGARLAANVPQAAVAAPLWIAQGLDDTLVLPPVQDDYVARRCAAGQPIHYVHVTGRDHLSLVAADSPLSGWLMQWTTERFAGIPPPDACTTETR